MTAIKFITESNMIEGIHRKPTKAEIAEYRRFVALDEITIEELKQFVSVYQPDAKIREHYGMNVRVGNYRPPKGGEQIIIRLSNLLLPLTYNLYTPFQIHKEYEGLHPFTDCNGRSGRMLWAWQMNRACQSMELGFLHHFYYQALGEE